MRISKLSAQAGLPVGTVKFYLRTGLLHSGRATGATQALYDETHLARLRLVRALLEVGGLSLAEIQRVIDAVALHRNDPARGLGVIHEALSGTNLADTDLDLDPVRALIDELGWRIAPDSPHLPLLARSLKSLELVGLAAPLNRIQVYAEAATHVARDDRALIAGTPENQQALTCATSTVLFDAVLVALRRLAGEHLGAHADSPQTAARMALPGV